MTENKHEENKVVVLDDVEHILTVPSRFIGSTSPKKDEQYVYDGKGLDLRELTVVPAFVTLFREVVSNSVDEFTRTKGDFANKIDCGMDAHGYLEVRDNGRGLSHEDAVDSSGASVGTPQSVVAFTKTKAGTNFKEKTAAIGQNGEGVSLVNIFSKRFLVETANGKKITAIDCGDNLSKSAWTIKSSRKRYTMVRWLPDYERLNVDRETALVTYGDYFRKILLDMSVSYPGIKFTWNGEPVQAKSFKQYASLYGDQSLCVLSTTENVDVAVFASYDYSQASWVNGIYTRRGGLHVEYVTHFVVKELRKLFEKKYPEIKPADIKNKMFLLVVVRGMKAPRFDSQTKEELINSMDDFDDGVFRDVDFADLARRVRNNKEISGNITEAFRIKEELARRKKVEEKEKKLVKISVPKLIETYHRNREECRLYLAEGQSATKQFIECRDTRHAAYPLRGKFINCMEAKRDKLIKNAEVKDLLAITGLKLTSKSIADLRYGKIVIFTDADYDGDSICCLLVAFFHKFWPDLIREGRLCRAVTPLVTATNMATKKSSYFFDMAAWRDAQANGDWRLNSYNKGLGSLSPEEYAFSLDNLVTITEDLRAAQSLAMAFGKNSDARKSWMMGDG